MDISLSKDLKIYDLKLYAKNEKELDTLVQTVRIFSDGIIGMEFSIQKCEIRGHIVESF